MGQGMKVTPHSFVAAVSGTIRGAVHQARRYRLDQAPKEYVAPAERYRRQGPAVPLRRAEAPTLGSS